MNQGSGELGSGAAEAGTAMTPAVLHVLLALDAGPRHGYAIMKAVQETAGLQMGPGTVYGTLQRLEEGGLVEETAAPSDAGARRRYYRLTPAGEAALRREAARIARLADLLRARDLAPARGGRV